MVSTATPANAVPAPTADSARKNDDGSAGVLVVFDYDYSLVDVDSEIFIVQQLYPELLMEYKDKFARIPWTQLMEEMLQRFHTDRPHISEEKIRTTLAQVPIQSKMLDAVRLAAATHGADVKIVSDSNTVYIQSMLDHYDLNPHLSEVVTNPAHFDEDGGEGSVPMRRRLRVKPYHASHLDPHGCPHCPLNMCKGRIMDGILSKQRFARVLYVGDGRGDFCAVTRLSKDDVVFARGDDADGKSYGLLAKIVENRGDVQASVVPWSTGEDIYNHFHQLFTTWKTHNAS